MRMPVFFAALLTAAASLAVPRPTLVTDPARAPFRGPPELAARAALARETARLGLGARTSLDFAGAWKTADGGHVVRFAQRHAGLPVLGAVVAVRLAPDGSALRVESSAASLGEVATVPSVPLREAIHLARGYLTVPLPEKEGGSATLVLTQTGRLAWHVFVPTLLPIHSMRVTVDALDGSLLGWRDAAVHAAQAKVFATGAIAAAARTGRTLDASKLTADTLGGLKSTNQGSLLDAATDDGIVGYNCCPNKDCDGTSPPPTVSGTFNMGVSVKFTAAMCEEKQTAAADAAGDFLYVPGEEPDAEAVNPAVSGDGDTFAEVMGYDFAQRSLARMVALDPQFRLGANGRPLRVTANFVIPNLREAMQNLQYGTGGITTRVDTLMRVANSAYVPANQSGGTGVPLPEFDRDFDSILLFQGPKADFAYDPDVVSHEFGHAIVAATAGLQEWAFDDQGIVDAPGAMNEGLSDFWAAARSGSPRIGEYVGKWGGVASGAGESTLRDLENTFKCPSVISGEVHQDSQHFSAALWAARVAVAGTDGTRRDKFDRAVLDAMRAMTPASTFDAAAQGIALAVKTAFDESAKTKVDQAFSDRKVTGCERVMDLEPGTPRKGYTIAPVDGGAGSTPAPGPVQFRLRPPAGTTRVNLRVAGGVSALGGLVPGNPMGGQQAISLKAIFKEGARVVFTRTNAVVADTPNSLDFVGDSEAGKACTSDAACTHSKQCACANYQCFLGIPGGTKKCAPAPEVAFAFDGACGGKELFLALANTSNAGPWGLESLSVDYEVDADAAAACLAPDAGPGTGSGGDTAPSGCGCGSAGALALALAGLLAKRRRATRSY